MRTLVPVLLVPIGLCLGLTPLIAQARPMAAAHIAILSASVAAQTGTGSSPSTAATTAAPAALRDITLTGTATWLIGASPQTIPVTLTALADGTSQESYGLAAGTETEQWSGPDGAATLTGRGAKGLVTEAAGGSIASPGFAWFAPALLLERASAHWDGADRGPDKHDGVAARHVAVWPQAATDASGNPAGPPEMALRQQARADVYLDPTTDLPQSAVFKIRPYIGPKGQHPARFVLASEEVRYGDYRNVDGLRQPFHLDVFLGGHALMHITITSASVNSGVTLAPLQ